MTARAPRLVACPHCGTPAPFAPENRWRPFCSERCRMIDLGNWATESYRVPALEDEPGPGSLAGPESDVLSSRG